MEYVLRGVAALGLLIAVAWISFRAKPLGDQPYRWATFIGIQGAIVAVSFLYLNYWRLPNLRILSLAVSCCGGVSSVGILRRRKFGVVTFAVTQVLVILFNLSNLRSGTGDQRLGQLGTLLSQALYGVLTIAYFWKRWNLLGPTSPDASSVPLVHKLEGSDVSSDGKQ